MSQTATYAIEGMTCGHCVNSVTEEVTALSGVNDVKIDLVSGGKSIMTLTADSAIEFEKIKEAVSEAGDYSVAAL